MIPFGEANMSDKDKHWQWEEDGMTVVRSIARTGPGCHEGCGVLLYVKDGKLVLEEYFNEYGRDDLHELHSVSKSITSILVGIAIDERMIPNVDAKVYAFFPEYKMKNTNRPTLDEMVRVFKKVKKIGLRNVKLGNCGVFAKSSTDWQYLLQAVGKEGIG